MAEEEDAGVVCCEVEDATVNWGVDPVPQCGTDASGVSTTASGGASDCCTTTESTCPEGKMNVNADTVIAGVKVETCCDPSSDGSQAEITNLDFDTLDACTASASTGNTGSTPSSAPSAAPKERVAVAIGMAILGAVLQ